MSEHPLDVLETACSLSQTNLDWPTALRAFEQLEQAARLVDKADSAGEYGPLPLHGDACQGLEAISDALAVLDRKEQTP